MFLHLGGLKNHKPLSLKAFHQRRNRVLVVRNARGLGDVLVHRMIFEDIRKSFPNMHLAFACPAIYHTAVRGHPFVDEVLDSATVNRQDFPISYDTSQCCIKYENRAAPFAERHRADIWAEHCGVKLTRHDMHLPILNQAQVRAIGNRVSQLRESLGVHRSSPNVLFCPVAYEPVRSLTLDHVTPVVKYLQQKGCFVYSVHHSAVQDLERLGVPVITGYFLPDWLAFVDVADYVVTVDTAVFHYAGGLKKPMTGIFTHVDGKVRGKYYEFVLVQRHRDDGDWPCGPCYNYLRCTHPKCGDMRDTSLRPCLTELTPENIISGVEKMFQHWPWEQEKLSDTLK